MAAQDVPLDNEIDGVAIIGIAGSFPCAENTEQLWENLINGIDCISEISMEEAQKAGVADSVLNDNRYIRRGGRVSKPQMFDAPFFGYNPREATLTDPQHRLFLQCGWDAIEDAGYNVKEIASSVGVFASCGMNYYLLNNLMANPKALNGISEIQMLIGNDKDFLATRLSYKLNLRGPSFDIQTACSSSLVAVHVACQNLISYQCDMALAGGVNLQIPWWNGYLVGEGDIRSPDGICRPFDEKANGTVFGEGVGVVVLKRVQEAINDRDHIYAVIRGSAVNNDGSVKAGYTAPGIDGQSEVITMALENAQVDASEINYIETHGTGTPLGDPVEIAGLVKAYRQYTDKKNYCAIGSVKASIGHLDAASGIAGLIKTALSLYHKKIPPSLNFSKPNPLLKLEETPFFVNNKKNEWSIPAGKKRKAGISSFGVGGTNAHLILEEAPQQIQYPSSQRFHILPFSSKSKEGTNKFSNKLSEYLAKTPNADVADIAFTLQNGRAHFPYRKFILSQNIESAVSSLNNNQKNSPVTPASEISPGIVFMFSGQGSQYIGMGKELYLSDSCFKMNFDNCSAIFKKHSQIDLSQLLFATDNSSPNADLLMQTWITQPALFSFEYSLGKMWENLGIFPAAMIGHSIGEYVAACLSGVFSLEDALLLVAERGKLMQKQHSGAMMSVRLPVNELSTLIQSKVDVAVVNSPDFCVVSGENEHIKQLQSVLLNLNVECRVLKTSHAFHSFMMDDAVTAFTSIVKGVTTKTPSIPFVSNLTGKWIEQSQTSDPSYWGNHLRQTVQFSDGITSLINEGYRIFLEIGPGNSLATFVSRTASFSAGKDSSNLSNVTTVTSVRHIRQQANDYEFFLSSLGKLWQVGANVNWSSLYKNEKRNRIALPTYPFDEKKYWVDPVSRPVFGLGVKYNSQPDLSETTDSSETISNNENDHGKVSEESTQQSSLQITLQGIWKELLGVDNLDPDISFFELGGDSIWAAQLISRVNNKIGVELTVDNLYEAPTFSGLLTKIRSLPMAINRKQYSGPVRTENDYPIPLLNSQQRLLFLYQLEPESPAFNLTTEFEIIGPFNKDCAFKAIEATVSRHDSLRSTFTVDDNGLFIRVNQKPDFDFESINFAGDSWKHEVQTRSRRPYNLEKGPLLRVLHIRLEENRHILAVMTHHIISDGWSMGVFLKDFTILYESILKESTPILPELPFRFADFSLWHAANHKEVNLDLIDYWKEELALPLPVLELPSDKKRPPAQSYHGSAVHFSLDSETSRKLDALSKNEQATTFTLILSAFYLLISKYSGHSDIIVGTPVANRNSLEVENIFGFFLNMIPLRIKSRNDLTFHQLWKNIISVALDAFKHQEIPFDELVKIVKPRRDASYPPVFQVMFAFQNYPIQPAIIGETTINPILNDRGTTEFDLSLYVWSKENTFIGSFEYNTDLFEHRTIENLSNHFVNIVQTIADSIDCPISEISLLSDKERNLIEQTWNKTDIAYPENECIHDLFREIASKYPDRNAVVTKNEIFTYHELDNESDKVAFALQKNGVKPGDLVGICLNRSKKMVSVLLGILKSGAAYVPLDPAYPQDRLAYMIEDASLRIIITEKSIRSSIPQTGMNVNAIEIDSIQQSKDEITGEKAVLLPDSTAYVIYTSGSTGKPKGVRISHRAVVNFLTSMRCKFGITHEDIVLAITTLSFDISVLEIFLPLTTGACTVLADNETARNSLELIELIKSSNVSVMQGTSSMWRMLIASGWDGAPVKALCGGEPFPYDLVRELLPKVTELWNMYGPTEATVWATCQKITDPQAPVYIGRPIGNIKTYILDSSLNSVPIGVPGELYIGGVGLAEGYHNKPEMNTERFIANPFANGLIYRTGDLTRYRHNGEIEFLGRMDSQVKIRGFRIELGEIENVALKHPEICECVAICKEFSPGDLRLLLFYTIKEKVEVSSSDIRSHLRTFLPEYMIPQHFVEVSHMPLTPAGKIDRNALPIPFLETSQKKQERELPQTPQEKYLANIWKQVLGVSEIKITDNFFDLGGHSLLSTKVIAQIKNETRAEVHPRAFMFNTLGQIAANHDFTSIKSTQNEKSPKTTLSLQDKIKKIFKLRK